MDPLPSISISSRSDAPKSKKRRGRPSRQHAGGGIPELAALEGWPDEHGQRLRLDACQDFIRLWEAAERAKQAKGKDYGAASVSGHSAGMLGSGRAHALDVSRRRDDAIAAVGFSIWPYVRDCLVDRKTLKDIGRRICGGKGRQENWRDHALGVITIGANELVRFFDTPRNLQTKSFAPGRK